MALRLRTLSLNLPFGMVGAEINVNRTVANAASNLDVEFATRVAVQPLAAGDGSARQAMHSLYTLFGVTREVLRAAGPGVADGRTPWAPSPSASSTRGYPAPELRLLPRQLLQRGKELQTVPRRLQPLDLVTAQRRVRVAADDVGILVVR
jgi:hypothetical protein